MANSFPPIKGVRHHFVNLRGVRHHVALAGEGPPLLMLHGWPQHWYMWRHQIPVLSKSYQLICLDFKGCGWSDAPTSGYRKEELVDDVVSLLDALRLDKVRLMGHDWGGWIGFLLCLRKPARVSKYLALNIPHPFQSLDVRLLTLWRFWYQVVIAAPFLGPWILRDKTSFVRFLLRRSVVNKRLSKKELAVYTTRFDEFSRAQASTALYRTFLLREFIPVLAGRYASHRLTVPTLMLFGTEDFAISTQLLKGYQTHTQRLKLELVPRCGHLIVEERAALVNRRSLEFFQ